MSAPKYNWRKSLLSLSAFVISKIQRLTDSHTHIRALIIDDSSFYRNRSKKIPQLAWLFDHALHQSYKGFRLPTHGFSDGHSFIPIDFALLSVKNQLNLTQLFKNSRRDMRATKIISSIRIRLQSGLPIKDVFVQNRNKKSEWFAIMMTDVDLTSQEIVKIYRVRRDVKTFF